MLRNLPLNAEEVLDKCGRIYEHYGYEKQMCKLVEELGELVSAISKHVGSGDEKPSVQRNLETHMVEEAGDVIIMMAQFIHGMNDEGRQLLASFITEKLDRERKRIEERH